MGVCVCVKSERKRVLGKERLSFVLTTNRCTNRF
jgi:hypothetical protein